MTDVRARSGWSLRPQLILIMTILIATAVGAISAFFIDRHRAILEAAAARRVALMRQDLATKGMALTRNTALVSQRAIVVMDFPLLLEVLQSIADDDAQLAARHGREREIVYGIIMDRNRRAVVHTDGRFADTVLDGPADRRAAAQDAVGTHEVSGPGETVLEAVAPIMLVSERWGTVRIGLSMKTLEKQIRNDEQQLLEVIRGGVLWAAVSAGVLLLLGALLATATASQIVRPIAALRTAATRIADGDLDVVVQPHGSAEIADLGRAFNGMTRAVKERDDDLRRNKQQLERAVDEAEELNRTKDKFLANMQTDLRPPLELVVQLPPNVVRDYQTIAMWHCDACGDNYRPDGASAASTAVEPCPRCKVPMSFGERLAYLGDAVAQRDALDRLQSTAQTLLQLVNSVLDLSRLEAAAPGSVDPTALEQVARATAAVRQGAADPAVARTEQE